jgi:Zn-dependent peptidase ImmA (M78 family)/DNA-binding XRE family transcriptional regulator
MNLVSNGTAVRPELIVLAREARGLTQSKLAAALDISQGHLSKIEGGLLPVSEAILDRLAEVLDYPPQFFALSEPIYGPGASEFFHRKRSAMSTRLLARLHARINIRRMQLSRLLPAVEIAPDRIPELDPEAFSGSVEDVARAVRAAWNLPRGPIANVTQTIEDAGGIVLLIDFGSPLLDAVSRYIPGLPPLFFENLESSGDRARMTLSHELGHVVMHRVPTPDMEAEAFRFAGEFLMPERDIRHELDSLSIDRLVALKLRWRVSMQALIMRAGSLGIISPRRAQYLWMQMSRAGFRVREPAEADVPREHPRFLTEIVDVYRHTLGYSTADLADLLAVHPHELETNYGLQLAPTDGRARLRMVSSAS